MEHSTAITIRADYRHHGQRDRNTLPFLFLAILLMTADEGRGIEIARAMAIRGSSRGKGKLPHKKNLHIPLQSAVAIASERRAVGAMLTARHALFCINFSKIRDFQQVGKNDRGKFVQNGTNCQSHKHDCPSKMATYGNFRANCHKKRAIFEKTPPLHYGVKAVGTFLDIIQK